MDEIKSVIGQLPPQDIAILKTLYNPEVARQELTDNGQRMVAILDGLSAEEQQEAVNVIPEEMSSPEQGDMNVEISDTTIEEVPNELENVEEENDEDKKNMPNLAGNLEDFLI